jgi:ribonuclease HI
VDYDASIFFDGGCTSNPGKLAVAAVVCTTDCEILIESVRDAGEGTSNLCEYRALMYAICLANLIGARRPLFISDSMLVVQQINGAWAMKGDTTSPLVRAHGRCYSALMRFDKWALTHVPRERNKRADWLVSNHLGHDRTLKKVPGMMTVDYSGEGRPGWDHLPPSRPASSVRSAA